MRNSFMDGYDCGATLARACRASKRPVALFGRGQHATYTYAGGRVIAYQHRLPSPRICVPHERGDARETVKEREKNWRLKPADRTSAVGEMNEGNKRQVG